MRVLIVNTSEKTGGAAVAANRLMDALNNNGVKAKMLVRDKLTDRLTVIGLRQSWRQRWNFLWERWCVFWHLHGRRQHLFEIDMANMGSDITRLPEFQEADVIHLHWINQGMLSLRNIRKILDSGKAVVWTMHDLWPASSLCHYARTCNKFKSHCQYCPLLPGGGSEDDLSSTVWNRKVRMLKDRSIHFVTCSRWLAGEAKKSALLKGQHIYNIPNPIDTRIFRPLEKKKARHDCGLPYNKRYILFVSQRVTDERKGMDYFVTAVDKLVEAHPEMKETTGIAILGGHSEEFEHRLALPVYPLGYVNDERQIVNIYNAASLFVLPSLEDNLPNTIMEAMACGVPCAGFKVGGIPEMIDHRRNGYVAEFRNADDLATGMYWVLDVCDYQKVSNEAVTKVAHSYSQTNIALRYIEVYNEALALKHYKL